MADLKGDNNAPAVPGLVNRTRVEELGLFTGRVGYAWDAATVFVKGGAAVAHDRYDSGRIGVAPSGSASENRWGGPVVARC